ncbi:hypothetical protein D3C85_1612700 [compost metagenome]
MIRRQVLRSITEIRPWLMFGVANTQSPLRRHQVPEPRCGMPGRAMRLSTWPLSRSITWPPLALREVASSCR